MCSSLKPCSISFLYTSIYILSLRTLPMEILTPPPCPSLAMPPMGLVLDLMMLSIKVKEWLVNYLFVALFKYMSRF